MSRELSPESIQKIKEGSLKGGYAKRGKRHKATIEREETIEAAKDLIAGRTMALVNKQLELALGEIKVFCIRYHWEGSGENKKLVGSKPEIVRGDEKMNVALDYELGKNGYSSNPNTKLRYFFVICKEPNLRAIDSILDRTFGKATENKNLVVGRTIGEVLDELENEENTALECRPRNIYLPSL